MTNKRSLWAVAAALACASQAWGQQTPKGTPGANRLEPRTGTFYVNSTGENVINNNKLESLGVGIAANGNVLMAWEDDGSDLADIEAVWTMYSPAGGSITEARDLKSVNGASVNSKFLSYFRKDGSPIPGNTTWGPKIKANLFGDGIGMGSTAYDLGLEVPELKAVGEDAGGWSVLTGVRFWF